MLTDCHLMDNTQLAQFGLATTIPIFVILTTEGSILMFPGDLPTCLLSNKKKGVQYGLEMQAVKETVESVVPMISV
ncbi:X-Linked Interleukin-1 Receptor Accessory Protein-Like 2 [Manis pentadactyla]|nr:X-Linked Interleukin-1 Receptor Accessory Protein-Like 2 [Manis pentadactyla]